MNLAKKVKAKAVPSAEINRQGRCTGFSNQASRGVAPYRVGDFAMGKLPVRYFPCGKDGQHSAAAQPGESLPHRAPIDVRPLHVRTITGYAILKWIDKNAVLRQFGNVA